MRPDTAGKNSFPFFLVLLPRYKDIGVVVTRPSSEWMMVMMEWRLGKPQSMPLANLCASRRPRRRRRLHIYAQFKDQNEYFI